MSSPKTIEELKQQLREGILENAPDINISNINKWVNSQNLPKLLKQIQMEESDNASNSMSLNLSNNGSVNSSPPNSNVNNYTGLTTPAFVHKKAAPRLPNGSVKYNAMANQWKEGVKSDKIKVTPRFKNTRSLQNHIANLTQTNRNKMERNKKALLNAVVKNTSIKNKSSFMNPSPGYISKNMRNRFSVQNTLNATANKAKVKQNALNALRGKKGPNVNRHTSIYGKSRKNRRNRK